MISGNTISHVRTSFRLVPTAMIMHLGQMTDNPSQIYLIDRWKGKKRALKGADIITMASPDAACAAIRDIRLALAIAPRKGLYARLFMPGHFAAPKGASRADWYVIVEDTTVSGREQGRIGAFNNEADARIEFDAICSRAHHALDFTRLSLVL